MKIAVISDIHGNMDAFSAVLEDIDRIGADAFVCLGDSIGYGPEPEQVVSKIRELNIPSILGNHELALTNRENLKWFNPAAQKSLIKTFEMLSEASINYICGLKTCIVSNNLRFVHGFPPDSITTYLFQISNAKLKKAFENLKEKICFIGHTHELEIASFDGNTVTRSPLKKGVMFLFDEKKYIINAGSVGQPRDGSNHAKYLIWDTSSYLIDVRFVPYDVAATIKKIRQAGLPEAHARRLL